MKPYKNYPLSARIFRKIYPLIEKYGLKWHEKFTHKYYFFPLHYPYPEIEKSYLEKAKKQKIKVANVELQTYEWGELSSENTVLLVHGWAGRATQFRSIIDMLSKNHRIISFDSPGHGLSAGKTTDMIQMAEITVHFARTYNITNVIGHSLGGAACIYAITEHKLTVDKLILISAPSNGEDMVNDFVRKINGGEKTKNYILKMIKETYNKELDDFFAESILPYDPFPKTLAIHDQVDYEVRFDNLKLLENSISDIETLETKNLGHTKILRDGDVLNKIQDFLKN